MKRPVIGERMVSVCINVELHYYVRKQCDRHWRLDSLINFYDLTFVHEGSCVFYIDGKKHEINEGEAVFVPYGSYRKAHCSGMRCTALSFTAKLGGAPPDTLSLPPVMKWKDNPAIIFFLNELHRAWLTDSTLQNGRHRRLAELILMELLDCCSVSKFHPYVDKIKKLLNESYAAVADSASIGRALGLHPVYCGALFKEYEGCTMNEYLHRIRIEHAVVLLMSNEFTISQIAQQTGYNDSAYFSRVFKSYKGISPKNYQKSRYGRT